LNSGYNNKEQTLRILKRKVGRTTEKYGQFNIETYLAFTDFEKAFDKVNRNTLLDILATNNIPDQIIHAT
jgi:uncharacterized surface protein with fasciclin (FAS1) repeats